MKGKRPTKPNFTEPAKTSIAEPPPWLGEYAREEWIRVHAELVAYGANIGGLEYAAMTCYCEAFGNVRTATEEIERRGILLTGRAGTVVKNPAVTALGQAQAQLRAWAVELGLTPASKGKIPMAKSGERVSKFKLL